MCDLTVRDRLREIETLRGTLRASRSFVRKMHAGQKVDALDFIASLTTVINESKDLSNRAKRQIAAKRATGAGSS